MISAQTVRKLALRFEQVEELPHFDKTSFRVKKKIFATLNEKQQRATLKLSENDQSIFSLYGDKTALPFFQFRISGESRVGHSFCLIKSMKIFLMMH